MKINSTLCLLYATLITLSLIYAPQPLGPLLGDYFHLEAHKAVLIISLTLLPMALAPSLYGYFLEKFSAKKILFFSLLFCSILQILSSFAKNFEMFLFLRLLQSLFFPSILTTLLTMLTKNKQENIQKYASLYVSATITGGLVGRILASFFTSIWNWQTAFIIFGILMLIGSIWSLSIKEDNTIELNQKLSFKDFTPFLKNKAYFWLLLSVFVMFFSLQSILNVMPFFLVDTTPSITQNQIGILYFGYLIGIIVSLFAYKITAFFHSRVSSIAFGFIVSGIGVLLMLDNNFLIMLLAMFILCAGSFTCHSILTALINSISNAKKGLVNGMYLTFYYTGGVIGSFLPSIFYIHFGWYFVCIFTSALLFINAWLFFRQKSLYIKGDI